MNLIVAVDQNWAIGYKNQLLVAIPADQRFFRETTTGKTVLCGRKTLDTFPSKRPLKNRKNIILSTKEALKVPDAQVVHSKEEALEALKSSLPEDIFIIGGGTVYEQFMEYCEVAYVTKIRYSYQADTYFPNLDHMPEWQLESETEEQTYYDLEFTICKYIKR